MCLFEAEQEMDLKQSFIFLAIDAALKSLIILASQLTYRIFSSVAPADNIELKEFNFCC